MDTLAIATLLSKPSLMLAVADPRSNPADALLDTLKISTRVSQMAVLEFVIAGQVGGQMLVTVKPDKAECTPTKNYSVDSDSFRYSYWKRRSSA
jgi:hypothetical protein